MRNSRPSYMLDHYFSNHFKWSNDFDRIQKIHIDGLVNYSRTKTSIRAGLEYINNYIYFTSDAFLPKKYDKQI